MNKEQSYVRMFHEKYGALVNDVPTKLDDKTLMLRARLICEESVEFLSSASKGDYIEMVDALCDILYVVYGTGVSLGVDLEPIFAEVQRSNMTKDGGGQDSGGKVIKGPNFNPPDIAKKLKEQGWVGG